LVEAETECALLFGSVVVLVWLVGSSGHQIVLYLIAIWSLFSNKIFQIHVLLATLSFSGSTKSELLKFYA
jgi:hypothetical protein